MHFDMPIQQTVRRTDTRFQLGFGVEARRLIPQHSEYVLKPTRGGLLVLARSEEALAVPVETLREVYGPKVQVRPPVVRLIEGVQVHEPIMHVRISMLKEFGPAVKAAMLARGATPEEEYARERYCVLRYVAPLARLLGLPGELRARTAGTGKHWIALSHYALVTGDPGGDAA
jgi:predicted membrane GTPase involved in stress response